MDVTTFFLILYLLQTPYLCSSKTSDTLLKGASLSVEKPRDVLVSTNGDFCAGFFRVGDNAFSFAIWFNKSSIPTAVWMANRDQPVNGEASKLSILKTGNVILRDAGIITVWSTETASASASPVKLQLLNSGNLVLHTSESEQPLWQSFHSPTDTLLPNQLLTENISLISSRSRRNYSSGYYRLYFDNDNVLRLLFKGPITSGLYWPDPSYVPWEFGRTTYNISKTAHLNSQGHFRSTDSFEFVAADFGMGPKRRLTLDPDGNLRLYSLVEIRRTWKVTWQNFQQPCEIHGICGPNSFCSYHHALGRRCSCLQGYKVKNPADRTLGCEPDQFNLSSKNNSKFGFVRLANVVFYGFDAFFLPNYTFKRCEEDCLKAFDNCKGFQYKISSTGVNKGIAYDCYLKNLLLNGFHSPDFEGDIYFKVPKAVANFSSDKLVKELRLDCSQQVPLRLNRTYEKARENNSLKFLLWFAIAIGSVELACIFSVWCFLFRDRKNYDAVVQGYIFAATGFRKFSYKELKTATRGFAEEIGRGAAGVVYKGILSDNRVAAIKRLNEANQGEAEFLSEISFIGRLNHMNLIDMWGYCAEGKHRLLVFEYMERGSLAASLFSDKLNWEKRFGIALGTAKGLAYLHEECLEWILHCDIKPQNILLDSDYHPKVSDFGLSKLSKREKGELKDNLTFSRIRGTRGYMAPEWVYNLPITSKVDVYSYGVVLLEMITGKSTFIQTFDSGGVETEHGSLVTWVRDIAATKEGLWIEEIVDPMMADDYDVAKMEVVIRVALQCVEEDKDARPTMSQVVEMLV